MVEASVKQEADVLCGQLSEYPEPMKMLGDRNIDEKTMRKLFSGNVQE